MTGTLTASTIALVSCGLESLAGAVAVHRRQQDLAGTQGHGLRRPLDRVRAGRRASAVQEHLVSVRVAGPTARASIAQTTHCAPNSAAISVISSRPLERGGVDADLVGTGAQHPACVLDGADPAADGERDEHLLGDAA